MADPTGRPDGIRAEDPQPDGRLGLRRALAMHLLMAALPGSAYIWQGEELGLPEHTSLPDDVREDPAFFRTRGRETGRDGCRVPLPWVGDAPGFGFSPEGSSWLPQPADWRELAVDAQVADEASTLSFFRRMLALRRRLGLGHGGLADVAGVRARGLRYLNTSPRREDVLVLTAFDEPIDVPDGWRVLISSAEVGGSAGGPGAVPADATAWLVREDS